MFMIIIQDIIRHPATWSVQSTPVDDARKGIRQDIEKKTMSVLTTPVNTRVVVTG